MREARLIGESFSPWTQKARWALEYCRVPFRYEEYTPTLSEPWLRWRMRQWSGAMSVPVLHADGRWIRGSWEIALHATRHAGGGLLGDPEAFAPWNAASETALAEGRTRVVRAIGNDPAALQESLPAWIPATLRPKLRWIARNAVRRLDRKYAHLVEPGSLRAGLLEMRRALAASGSGFLLDRFGYADIAMAVVLECVEPIARTVPPPGPSTRRHWRDAALAREFEDLLHWRRGLLRMPGIAGSQFRVD